MKKSLFLILSVFFCSSINAQISKIYLSGNSKWSVPSNIDTITVECWGAGGGAGNSGNTQAHGGAGGGGGAYSKSVLTNVAGFNHYISVGQAGIKGLLFYATQIVIEPTGGSGSYFSKINAKPNTQIQGVFAAGGGAGSNNYGPLGIGGQSSNSVGQITFSGGNGMISDMNGGGGGGASGNLYTDGFSAIDRFGAIGQNGGGSGGIAADTAGGNGQDGISPGGGGGGSDDWWQSVAGNGGDGKISILLNGMFISGSIYNDANKNCINDPGEMGLPNVPLIIKETGYVATTDNEGNYYLPKLGIGSYTLIVSTPRGWNNSCSNQMSFNVVKSDSVINLNSTGLYTVFPYKCTAPNVSIYAPILRRCFSGQIYVNACNQTSATGILDSSYVDVEIDPLILVNGASLPYTALGNNTFRFETGKIDPGQCVNFNISIAVSCNAFNGKTLCMEAKLYPVDPCVLDTVPSTPPPPPPASCNLCATPKPCTLPWDKSNIRVTGVCKNDTICFTVMNSGGSGLGDMQCYGPVRIFIDGVLTYTDSIRLSGGQKKSYCFPGDGKTWTLEADQHPLFPGNYHPTAHVEACGDTTNWTPDLVNDLPQDDADPVVDVYCGLVTGSFDPNDKTGFPKGLGTTHEILPGQQLQYVIRFQNTGNDTAFTVVVRDTLPAELDIFSVVPGVSSHSASFRMYGPRVLEWTFNNINLPDSNKNEPASHGFVSFTVDQAANLPLGTTIKNDADIYFDFNAPVITNQTLHTVNLNTNLVTSIKTQRNPDAMALNIYPNPVLQQLTVSINPLLIGSQYAVYDMLGKLLMSGKLMHDENTIIMSGLENGIYIIKAGESGKYIQKFIKSN